MSGPFKPIHWPCGNPLCGARVGEPCRHTNPHKSAPHDARKKWAKGMNRAHARRQHEGGQP